MKNFNDILQREPIYQEIKKILNSYEENSNNINLKKGIYIQGSVGCGKTKFITNLLEGLDYDVVNYDAGDVRNKNLMDTITSDNMSNRNVLQMMCGKTKKIAILMDEIDGMNGGDKGGINHLIKLIRHKKTKKQKMENWTLNPIICIGNNGTDKKVKELMKVCNVFELKTPTREQIQQIIEMECGEETSIKHNDCVLNYIQGDLRKMEFVIKLYKRNPDLVNENTIENLFHKKTFNENAKNVTKFLLHNRVSIDKNNFYINETDRTIVGLLWHENIIDILENHENKNSLPFYLTVLNNICYADYIDRITFQNQIWNFNEMSSLIKTFHTNMLYHNKFQDTESHIFLKKNKKEISEKKNKKTPKIPKIKVLKNKKTKKNTVENPPIEQPIDTSEVLANKQKKEEQEDEIRFTKVLTKYSTEYNNMIFINNLCQELNMDKKDLISFFRELQFYLGKNFTENQEIMNEIEKKFETYNINKLDIKRIYRYLDKNIKKTDLSNIEEEEDTIIMNENDV